MFDEDLSEFFSLDDFAVEARLASGAVVPVIFDREYVLAHGMVSSSDPVALARAADVPTSAVARTIVISGSTYTIRAREPMDDGAVVRLQLEAV